MYARLWVIIAVAVAIGSHEVCAEVPVLTEKELRENATDIVVGKVQKVYASTSRDESWETTNYVAEIAVESTEKGKGTRPGELAYARYWHTAWIGTGQLPPHASGHRLVASSDTVRAFLARSKRDGGLDVLLPNGFEVVGKSERSVDAKANSR